ncbi:hypothetical protein FD04_GL001458 [Secundilactobacillus odoratitofui DSM 19909 = JCM 15043]|uniref:Uncharacterized protein n=2 Tax=Secundilactobacillus odoratitofui TaxID=480930 RepID=A0A0R1LX24_9LACO|nr:hypothetical protein FD04_GL001458 [Secundilactobacillus odoratitofui DSM 19909 = JCM 15043]
MVMAQQQSVRIQLPQSVDMTEIAQILETAFEAHGIESYHVSYNEDDVKTGMFSE